MGSISPEEAHERLKAGDKTPWLVDAVASDPHYAYLHARDVIKGRWPQGEKAIDLDSFYAGLYKEFFKGHTKMTQQAEQHKSVLPALEQIHEESTMRIITINTYPFKRKLIETFMTVSNDGKYSDPRLSHAVAVGSGGESSKPLQATLVHLDDERIKGFMPSKVWGSSMAWYGNPPQQFDFNILYYINSTMPLAVKPFKDNTYLMYFVPRPGDEISHDVNVRFFMDQVMVPNVGMVYVVMFGDESYKDIVLKETPDRNMVPFTASVHMETLVADALINTNVYTEEALAVRKEDTPGDTMKGWIKKVFTWRIGD